MSHIVITGASSGIGAALAMELAAQGHRLVLAARREPELRDVAERAGDAFVVVADVTRREDVERLGREAVAHLGHVDVWINNAGQGITRPVLELTDEDVDAVMAVNLKSVLYGMQVIVPHFQQRGCGHLINVSSFLGRVPLASFRSIYNAAKAGVNSLSANLRMDLAAEYPDIHVSLVMPGMVATEFARNARGGQPTMPLGGVMQPQSAEEVAHAIVELMANPVAEIYTNPASAGMARAYHEDVAAFEARMVPARSAPSAGAR